MEHLLKYVVRIFKSCQLQLEQRWAQEAIHMALSCSSRHYAGRSFQVFNFKMLVLFKRFITYKFISRHATQIFRSLQVPLSPNDLCDILSRLVETVADHGEDMQVAIKID